MVHSDVQDAAKSKELNSKNSGGCSKHNPHNANFPWGTPFERTLPSEHRVPRIRVPQRTDDIVTVNLIMKISRVELILLHSYIKFLKNLNLHAYGLSVCSSVVVYLIGRPLRGQGSRSITMKDLDKKASKSNKVNISKAALRLQSSLQS